MCIVRERVNDSSWRHFEHDTKTLLRSRVCNVCLPRINAYARRKNIYIYILMSGGGIYGIIYYIWVLSYVIWWQKKNRCTHKKHIHAYKKHFSACLPCEFKKKFSFSQAYIWIYIAVSVYIYIHFSSIIENIFFYANFFLYIFTCYGTYHIFFLAHISIIRAYTHVLSHHIYNINIYLSKFFVI